MRGKKIILFLVCLVIVNFVIAAETKTCPSEDDIILRLYSSKNSHGALWNQPSYNYQICYSDIFGSFYSGSNPHDCNGNNKVVGLYSQTNSHAEIPSKNNYAFDVCYGDLVCRSRDVSKVEDCATNEKVVVRLYQGTNSHLSNSSDNNYMIKICCKSPVRLFWADMRKVPITVADLNDRVMLVVKFDGLSVGESVEYKIYNSSDDVVYSSVESAQSNNFAYHSWRANMVGNFYFKVNISSSEYDSRYSPSGNIYGWIEILPNEENSLPYVEIVSPKEGDIFVKGESIDFNQTSYDVDDFIDYTWKFEDGSSVSGSTRDYVNYNVSHTYSIIGQMNVNLEVVDERGSRGADSVNILILDFTERTNYTFANITSPEMDSKIDGLEVQFNASSSFAIEVIPNSLNPSSSVVNCLAGQCPSQINLASSGSVLTIQDPYGKKGNFNHLTFIWEFDDGDGTCDGINKKDCREFKKVFGYPGEHYANLKVSLDSGSFGQASVRFSTSLKNVCSDGGKTWWDSVGKPHKTLVEDEDYCKGLDIGSKEDDCCPPNYECVDDGDPLSAGCKLSPLVPPSDVRSCSDYKDQVNCTNDPYRVGMAGGGGIGTESCGVIKSSGKIECGGFNFVKTQNSCRCEWDGVSGKCNLKSVMKTSLSEGDLFEHKCLTSFFVGECIDDLATVKEDSKVEWDPDIITELSLNSPPGLSGSIEEWLNSNCNTNDICPSGERQVVCGESFRLQFFSWFNLVFSVLVLVIFYLVVSLKNSRYLVEK